MKIEEVINALNNEFTGLEYIYNFEESTSTHILQILNNELFKDGSFVEFMFRMYSKAMSDEENILFVDSESVLYPTTSLTEENYSLEFDEIKEEELLMVMERQGSYTAEAKPNTYNENIFHGTLSQGILELNNLKSKYTCDNNEDDQINLELAA